MIHEKNPHNLYFVKEKYKKLVPYLFYYVAAEDEKNHYLFIDGGVYAVLKKDVIFYSAPNFRISKEQSIDYLKFNVNESNPFDYMIYLTTLETDEKIKFTLDDLIDSLTNLINEDLSPLIYKNYLENFYNLVFQCKVDDYFVVDPLLEDESHLVSMFIDNISNFISGATEKDKKSIDEIKKILKDVELSTKNINLPFDKREFTLNQKIFIVSSLSLPFNQDYLKDFKVLRKYNLILDELEEIDNKDALIIRGYDYYNGSMINDVDYQEALKRFLKVSHGVDEGGFINDTIGYIYYYPRINDTCDYEKAYKHFSKAALYGNVEAKLKLVDMYLNGQFVEKDINIATKLIDDLYFNEMERFYNDLDSFFPELCSRLAFLQLEMSEDFSDTALFFALFVLAYFKNKCLEDSKQKYKYFSYCKRMYELIHYKLNINYLPLKEEYQIRDNADLIDLFHFINANKNVYTASFSSDGDFLKIEISSSDFATRKNLFVTYHKAGISKMLYPIVIYFRNPTHIGFRKKNRVNFDHVDFTSINGETIIYFYLNESPVYLLNTKYGFISTETINKEPIYVNKIKIIEDNKTEFYLSDEPFLVGETVEVMGKAFQTKEAKVIDSRKTIKEDTPLPLSEMKYIYH
ncbi:MAG: tetratricopeptide repeat protein [Bacilli bacterium]